MQEILDLWGSLGVRPAPALSMFEGVGRVSDCMSSATRRVQVALFGSGGYCVRLCRGGCKLSLMQRPVEGLLASIRERLDKRLFVDLGRPGPTAGTVLHLGGR